MDAHLEVQNTEFTDIAWCPLVTETASSSGVVLIHRARAAESINSVVKKYHRNAHLKALLIAVEESKTQAELLDIADEFKKTPYPIFIISSEYMKVLRCIHERRSVSVQLKAYSGMCSNGTVL